MKMRILFIGLILTVFAGCTTSKTELRAHYMGQDWFAQIKTEPEKYWGNCIDISDEELKTEVNTICIQCIERELQDMPSAITWNDQQRFNRSVNACAIMKFFSKHKDKFTFDKSPQYLDECKEIFKYISTLK